ncbi:MAG: methionine--tRNA ligase [candidate division KSB1 bacterium]|nr:methionine--tRNA ligase [candidate division KSB1 bacterium]
MEQKEKILVTSALPYANGPIHLGHIAGAYLNADIYVRYQRLKQRDVVFICGTDEHGAAITLLADKLGKHPKEIVDYYHKDHKETFEKFGISFDIFSRTTESVHYETSQEFFLSLYKKGYLNERTIKQLYCPNDKRFLPDRYVEGTCPHCGNPGARGDQCEKCGKWIDPLSLKEPRCMICGTTPEVRETTHLYLDLRKFQDRLRAWLDTKTHWKDNVRNFCYGWLNEGLEERAVTRDLDWGVPVPLKGYEGKVLYVWIDAPIGYLSATKKWAEQIGDPERWRHYWQDENTKLVHFIGKDNIVFHAIVWPAVLMAQDNYILPFDIPANEFLNIEGRKISTSKNYAIWVREYLEKFPPDPMRYVIASTMPENKDSDFSWRDFQTRVNAELADILGNFINRTLTFVRKNYDGRVPERHQLTDDDRRMLALIEAWPHKVGEALEAYEIRKATRTFMDLAREANKYFNDAEPWRTIKEDRPRCDTALNISLQLCKALAVIMSPFLPFSAQKLWRMLNLDGDVAWQNWDSTGAEPLQPGHQLGKPEILFRKYDDDVIEEEIQKLERIARQIEGEPVSVDEPEETKSEEKPVAQEDLISIDDFAKVQLRVARVESAQKVEGADRLLQLQIDLGGEKRQIVAGIAQHYRPEEMVGKQIIVVANLKPAKIRGLESQGMLLAATDDSGKLCVLVPEKDMQPGAKVR